MERSKDKGKEWTRDEKGIEPEKKSLGQSVRDK